MSARNQYAESLLKRLDGAHSCHRLRSLIASGHNLVVSSGLCAGAASLVFARLASDFPDRPMLFLTASNDQADALMDDFNFLGLDQAFQYPRWEALPYDDEEPIVEIAAQQLETLGALARWRERGGPAPRIVAPVEALLRRTLSNEDFGRCSVHLRGGQAVDRERLAARLVEIGYERVSMTESRAEFSVRGGIVDVFPYDVEHPIRLDLFGEEIESIRLFDPQTQRSLPNAAPIEQVDIHPVRLNWLYGQWAAGGGRLAPFASLLPPQTLVVLDQPEAFEVRLERYEKLVERQYQSALEEEGLREAPRELPSPQRLFITRAEAERAIEGFPRLVHSSLPYSGGGAIVQFRSSSFEGVQPNLEAHLSHIATRQAEGYAVHIVCDNEGQVERLEEVLRERGLSAAALLGPSALEAYRPRDVMEGFSDIVVVVGALHAGFVFPEIQLAVVTDREIFGRYKRRRVYRKVYRGAPVASPSEIRRGDFVAHIEHGIGEFLGIRRQTIEGRTTELLEILYRDGAKLLVPIEKIASVQKYSSVDGSVPVLDRLGGKQWARRKSKTQALIQQMAEELLDLYARRSIAGGYAFGEDSVWQREFEASFLYEETPDQLEAIEQVKEDMRLEKPMDRLICGDVGYGKTEVAIRAAFKAVQEKRQVAVLAPTTILAQQHYNTFRERFADYPIQVEMLSRFRTPAEQRGILKRLSAGQVDVVIGTHRLLSKDLRFADLGLLIIDEEQRFGVRQKERIKALRTSVDILTLTATPIPRTLYMALSGMRDMSVINTPPPDRRPIRTKIVHFNREQIEEAILRETNRNGQIYFVHNRIHNIQSVAERLKEIVPEARIAIGHGQMNERELERLMLEFVDGRHDILLSTTIIENGLDIPNVNTIVINRADAFGLGQLYQLRGRVGRSPRQAYAYLIVPQGQPITEAAVRRLAAIQEFTELGSGFNVALRDLEIRGAGDLLGPRQHGAIQTVGFELYCQMLEETVARLRGQAVEADFPVEIVWRAEAYLPAEYVPVESHRISVYKRLAAARRREEIDDVLAELRDRYGAAPRPAENLCRLAALRVAARPAEITRVFQTPYGFKVYSSAPGEELAADFQALSLADSLIKGLRIEDDGAVHIALRARPEERLEAALSLMNHLAESFSNEETPVAPGLGHRPE